jgi:hypothetical protein
MRHLVYSARYSVQPINSLMLTVTLHFSVITTPAYNNTKYSNPFHGVITEIGYIFLPGGGGAESQRFPWLYWRTTFQKPIFMYLMRCVFTSLHGYQEDIINKWSNAHTTVTYNNFLSLQLVTRPLLQWQLTCKQQKNKINNTTSTKFNDINTQNLNTGNKHHKIISSCLLRGNIDSKQVQ